MIKQFFKAIALLIILGAATCGWAGPIDEVAALSAERGKAFEQGSLDAWVEAYADNAVVTPSFQAYRVEGKPAIRQFFSDMFQRYPKRRYAPRQSVSNAFGDNVVVVNAYGILSMTDDRGNSVSYPHRASNVWIKLNGQWRVVNSHNSRIPETDK